MSDTKHRHKWESVMTHHHGTFVVAEVEECQCGTSRSASMGTSRPFDMLTEECPDCGN